MKEFKGTKGEWNVADYGHCIAIETKLDNGQEHTVFTDQFCHASKFDGNALANSQLIAAAPELLEALQFALEVLEKNPKPVFSHRLIIEKAQNAIAKALGL